jgi:hypothetical protein
MNKHRQRHRREKRLAKRTADKVTTSGQPVIDGNTLIKLFEQRLDEVFGKVRTPILAGLNTKLKNKV